MKVRKVLLIEDFIQAQDMITQMIKIVFGEDTEVVVTGSLKEAEMLYEEHGNSVDVIFIDTNLENDEKTHKLAERIAQEFNRPLVAISAEASNRKEMIEAGCTHECDKHDVLKLLMGWKEAHGA